MEWSEIMADPVLQNLPFKVQQDEWGRRRLVAPRRSGHPRS